MTRSSIVLASLFLGLALAGCPSNGPGPVGPNPDDTDASVTPPPPVDAGPVEPPPPPPPSEYEGEPGTLRITATFNGAAIASPIEIRRYQDADIRDSATTGTDGEPLEFSLPPGRYDIRAGFPQAVDGMADSKEALRIRSGETTRYDFTFDNISQVTLECKRNGRNTNGTIRLRRPGGSDYLPEVRCQDEFFITGGAWEAEVTIGSGRSATVITIDSLQIVGGGVVRTPILIEGGGRSR